MKAILEFNLPDESPEHQAALHGTAYSALISEVLEYIRSELKYKELTKDRSDALDELRTKIYEYIEEYGVQEILR